MYPVRIDLVLNPQIDVFSATARWCIGEGHSSAVRRRSGEGEVGAAIAPHASVPPAHQAIRCQREEV